MRQDDHLLLKELLLGNPAGTALLLDLGGKPPGLDDTVKLLGFHDCLGGATMISLVYMLEELVG